MSDFKVEIQGLAQAKAALAELHPKQARAAERNALRAAGNLLAKAIRARAPVRTGRFKKKGVKVSVSVTMERAFAEVGISRIGRFNELGTKRMPARPFMAPALADVEDKIVETYSEAFKAQVAKAQAKRVAV